MSGDGRPEVVVEAPYSDLGGPSWEAAYVYSLTGPATLSLQMVQPAGPGSLRISNLCGPPGHEYFSAFTLDGANSGGGLGSGWWFGLHISWVELIQEYLLGTPPFVGTLDAGGFSELFYPAGSLNAFAGTTVYGVTTTFDPTTGFLSSASSPTSLTLQ